MKKKEINILKESFGSQKRWVNYRALPKDGRITKIPFSPITNKNASSMKESDWGTYDEAFACNPNFLGIVFTNDQTLLGIDIDHCLNGNQIEHEHKEIIAQFLIEADTYTEISPSKTGLHSYFKLTSPLRLGANRSGNFECYTSGRYFTVTNNPYKEAKEIRTITPEEALELLKIIGYPWGKKDEEPIITKLESGEGIKISEEKPPVFGVDSKELWDKIFASKGGAKIKKLYNGDISAYKDDASAADMALLAHLAFWTGRDPILMESMWMASPLGQREKTQQRVDYRKRSINTAIKNCKEVRETTASKVDAIGVDLVFQMYRGEKVFPQNLENMCRILRHHPSFKNCFRHDIFKNVLETKFVTDCITSDASWRALEDHDVLDVQTEISMIFPCFAKVGKDLIYDAVIKVSREMAIDSGSDWIRSLKWDGKERLDTWLSSTYNVPDDKYHRAVASNWMKGLVKRIVQPGCKFDYVLVLEGEQGIKKSTSLGILGGDWHVETAMSTDTKDFFMQFQGKAIIEFSEGETLSRTEVKRMKAIITMQSDKFRPPYGRTSIDFPRRCVFAMTTNQSEYLKDETGNRRWLPVACEGIANVEWLEANREQLFAEAYHRVVDLKETTYDFPKEETEAAQRTRRIHDPNEDNIAHWYFNKLKQTERDEGITSFQCFRDVYCGGMTPQKGLDRYTEMAIADVLKNVIRLKKERRMVDGIQANRWYAQEDSMESALPLPLSESEKALKDF